MFDLESRSTTALALTSETIGRLDVAALGTARSLAVTPSDKPPQPMIHWLANFGALRKCTSLSEGRNNR